MLPLLVLTSCYHADKRGGECALADSLNTVSAEMLYKDVAASLEAARAAMSHAQGCPVRTAEALNNEAACHLLRMDFEEAERLYGLAERASVSEIERLTADVGRMKICQSTAQNKRFYDFRGSAARRMERIGEEIGLVDDERQMDRLRRAVTESHLVTALYYKCLQQRDASAEAIGSLPTDMLQADSAQWLKYEYLLGAGEMVEAQTAEEGTTQEFDHLMNCLVSSRSGGYVHLESYAELALAEMLMTDSKRTTLLKERGGILRMLNPRSLPGDSVATALVGDALALAERQGDLYQISEAHRVKSIYLNNIGLHEEALSELKEALECVNRHHSRMYGEADSTRLLTAFREDDGVYPELNWITDEDILTVPEWILHLREQLSMTYSAMGMKGESDYNRNIYLDLLDYTRQDKQLESRYQTLENEARQLNVVLTLVIAGLLLLLTLMVVMGRRWQRRNEAHMAMLRRMLKLCRSVTAALPAQANETADVVDAVSGVLGREFASLFGAEDVRVTVDGDDEAAEADGRHLLKLPLISLDKDTAAGQLVMKVPRPLVKDEMDMLRLIVPYLAWTLENGLNLVSLDDRRRMLEKEEYVHSLHLAEGKRQNTVKRACLAIVAGMMPYIDRVANEVEKLVTASLSADVKREKLTYISELAAKINEQNDILTLWIKMKQGALNLNIETFRLDELLRIVARGSRSFELKRQTLKVSESGAVVKGDKALTLFMINTLAENARKYTGEGGEIDVYATETEQFVEVSVNDNGPGLSEDDTRRILGEKVYSSASIGLDTAADKEELLRQKGSGFGLMNCKGIIEKYRKTSAAFSVCHFGIESVLGRGSRFFFRLPKGTLRKVMQVVLLPLLLMAASCNRPETVVADKVEGLPADSLLERANYYANMVYYCNVDGYCEDALIYADSVLLCMNEHYVKSTGKDAPLLFIDGRDGPPAEQEWLEGEFDTDYYILLDVRNEAAVAALVLGDFEAYEYNNAAYSALYRLISRDRSLETYCEQMQRAATGKMVGVGIFCLLLAVSLLLWYVLYYRHRLLYRYNVEQLLYINRAVLSAASNPDTGAEEVPRQLVEGLFREINELVAISSLALAVYDEEAERLQCACSDEGEASDELTARLQQALGKRSSCWAKEAGDWSFIPLWAETGGESRPAGVLALRVEQANPNEEDLVLLEMAASYLAVVLYNTVVRVRRKWSDIELAEDEARRAAHEESGLHVQNMVLDNCLSTIKHETVYYPNRIKHIVDRLACDGGAEEEDERRQIETVRELVGYYRDVFKILSGCAARQLEDVTFRRGTVDAREMAAEAAAYMKRAARKARIDIDLTVEVEEGLTMTADRVLVALLLHSLADAALRLTDPGAIRLEARADGRFVRFDFTDSRGSFSQKELDLLFSPDPSNMRVDGAGGLVGAEYLICKQIVRDHDEFAGRRGCRINAERAEGGGCKVWFTLPAR